MQVADVCTRAPIGGPRAGEVQWQSSGTTDGVVEWRPSTSGEGKAGVVMGGRVGGGDGGLDDVTGVAGVDVGIDVAALTTGAGISAKRNAGVSRGWVVAACALFAAVVLIVLGVVYYGAQAASVDVDVGSGARALVFWVAIAAVAISACGLMGLSAVAVLRAVERSKLFVPTAVSRYRRASGTWYPLPSGGGLLHFTPDADPRARRVLFAHGNTLNLDPYVTALERFATCGYDIWAVEYAGYGITPDAHARWYTYAAPEQPGKKPAPCGDTLCRDLLEAWTVCGRDNGIVIGFSIGGALLGQMYEQLVPAPAQIVFLNTFWSVRELVASKLPGIGGLLGPLLETQWVTKPPRKYRGRVLIVWSNDDDVVPPAQSAELCSIFAPLNPHCVELPRGGHRWSSFIYMTQWCNSFNLLPA